MRAFGKSCSSGIGSSPGRRSARYSIGPDVPRTYVRHAISLRYTATRERHTVSYERHASTPATAGERRTSFTMTPAATSHQPCFKNARYNATYQTLVRTRPTAHRCAEQVAVVLAEERSWAFGADKSRAPRTGTIPSPIRQRCSDEHSSIPGILSVNHPRRSRPATTSLRRPKRAGPTQQRCVGIRGGSHATGSRAAKLGG